MSTTNLGPACLTLYIWCAYGPVMVKLLVVITTALALVGLFNAVAAVAVFSSVAAVGVLSLGMPAVMFVTDMAIQRIK